MTEQTLAFIFNWEGPQSLALYVIALVVAVLWSLKRRRTALHIFNPAPGSQPQLDDSIEIAYLAGGATRCAEVALVRLIENGSVSWKPGRFLKTGSLIATGPMQAENHWFERAIYSAVLADGEAGLKLPQLAPVIKKNTAPLEGHLAKLGLRPTASELSRRGTFTISPLSTLFVIGILKLLIGLVRDKPVGYLIGLLVVTFIVMLVIKFSIERLTPAGRKMLDKLRAGRLSTSHPGLTGVALFGVAGATAYAGMPAIDPSMMKELKTYTTTSASSSGCGTTGCSSGCGGGGGCGGCGS